MRVPGVTKRLVGDRRGTSVLELGLALPIFMVMIVSIIDVSRLHSRQIALQQAASRAVERIQVLGMQSNYASVEAEAAAAAGVTTADVDIDNWLECGNPPVRTTAERCTGSNVSSRYLQVVIRSSYTPHFGFSPVGARQANGSVALSADSVIRVN
jgi:Flp pilus assembly protein TadG